MFDPPEGFVPKRLLDQRVPMRDGVELSADIYLPPEGDGPWPAILQRTPYDNTLGAGVHFWPAIGAYYAARGYVLVSQDVRGRGDSDGTWEPSVAESLDGTLSWVQPGDDEPADQFSYDPADSRRNPNTNARTGDDDTWLVAHNTVCHSAVYPTHLLAPVASSPQAS